MVLDRSEGEESLDWILKTVGHEINSLQRRCDHANRNSIVVHNQYPGIRARTCGELLRFLKEGFKEIENHVDCAPD